MEADTGSSDTLNSGGYDTATTGKPTDLTTTANTGNTASPVVKSASYNFVAQDVNNWLWMGTSGGVQGWVQGWYKILSVDGSSQATLDASIGAVVLSNYTLNTAIGISTVATPTTGTFSVDYSQQAGVQFSLTGLTTAAANAIILTASATKAMVGNLLVVTGGTNFTAGTYVIQACTAGVSLTVDRNCTSAAGLAGTAGIGGALGSPGQAGALMVAGNDLFCKSGTYSITSASSNVAGGCVTIPAGASNSNISKFIGYQTLRGDYGTKPLLQASGINTFTLVTSTAPCTTSNISVDGITATSSRGFSTSSGIFYKCKAANCTNSGFIGAVNALCIGCEVTGCTVKGFDAINCQDCTAQNNTCVGFSITLNGGTCVNCIAANNTGSTSDGFLAGGQEWFINCTAYGNGRDGFRKATASNNTAAINCLATNNGVTVTGAGFNASASDDLFSLYNCAGFSNTGGNVGTNILNSFGFVTLTSDPFINAAGGNFALTPAAIALIGSQGLPGAFPGLSATTGYLAIGAVQPTAVRMLYAGQGMDGC